MLSDKNNNYDDYYGPNTPGMEYSAALSTASVIFGFLSLFSSIMFYVAIPCGALSILFALLSRGGNRKMTGKGRLAVILSLVGIAASAVMTISAIHMVMTSPQLRSQMETLFNYYAQEMGLDIEFDDYFGGSDTPESEQDDDDRANDYFIRQFGNNGRTPADNVPDDSGGFNLNPGSRQIPSGGEYI